MAHPARGRLRRAAPRRALAWQADPAAPDRAPRTAAAGEARDPCDATGEGGEAAPVPPAGGVPLRVRPSGAAALAVGALAACLAAAAPAQAGLRSGCDSTRPAVAYHPGGLRVRPQPRRRPLPCLLVVPGRAGESATVAVTGGKRVLYAPIVDNTYPAPLDDRGPARVTASDDGGATWRELDSGGSDHILSVPPWMSRDPV